MRHLSFAFAFVITLLFGHVVIALTPTGSRTGEEDTSLTLAHLPTPPERRVPGRIVRRASGGNHPPVVPTVGSLVRVPVGAHVSFNFDSGISIFKLCFMAANKR